MAAIGNRALSFSEEYSLESLWHELLHNQQLKILALSPSAEQKVLMETINQWSARHTYQTILTDMGIVPIHQAEIIEKGPGYGPYVERFNLLLSKLGIKSSDILNDVATIHKSYNKYDYKTPVANTLFNAAKKAGYKKLNSSLIEDVLDVIGTQDTGVFTNALLKAL